MNTELSVPARARQALLSYIEKQWNSLVQDDRPWGMWIRLHQPLPAEAIDAQTPLEAVWFMDRHGISPRDLWQYLRFYTVHQVQQWCSRPIGERDAVFGRRVHEIGWAAFARYEGSDDYYLEMAWGGLRAEGLRVYIAEAGDVVVKEQLWIS